MVSASTDLKHDDSYKLRNLSYFESNHVIIILSRHNCWQELAAVITHPDSKKPMFNSDDIGVLENRWRCGTEPADAMWYHWITSGVNQPDIRDLICFLKEAGLSRALSDVKKLLLKDTENAEDDDLRTVVSDCETDNNECEETNIVRQILSDANIEDLNILYYNELEFITNNFSEKNKIGEGAFGTVYKPGISDPVVAVKRFKNPVDKQFVTEINTLMRYRHENLLPLLGCSLDGPEFCLVYEFMVNGSLEDRLACVGNSKPLPWDVRLKIAFGSAQGINHLHTAEEEPMVHRDIKSANILLDRNFVPKVGDFGLVRKGSSGNSSCKLVTRNIRGTSVYMASEAFRGDVSIKLDTFSFGVVLLELITGSPPGYDAEKGGDLISCTRNCEDIFAALDPNIEFNRSAAEELYRISQLCLKECKTERPEISKILDDLEACLSYIPGT